MPLLSCTSPASSDRFVPIITSFLLLFALSGCAPKPWHGTLSDDGRKAMLDVIDDMVKLQQERPRCFDAEVRIFLTSYLQNRAASGYTQVMAPDTVKFITSNPFGQPLFAFVGNQQNFQYLNTLNRIYLDGDINEFASIYDFPLQNFSGPWGDWLSARIPEKTDDIIEMRADSAEKGIWVRYASRSGGKNHTGKGEYLLINPEQKLLIARTITDENGKIIARIDYFNRTKPPLLQPQSIVVTRLSYGAEFEVKFSDIREMENCEDQEFFLKRPAGYHYQRLSSAQY